MRTAAGTATAARRTIRRVGTPRIVALDGGIGDQLLSRYKDDVASLLGRAARRNFAPIAAVPTTTWHRPLPSGFARGGGD
jgi:hypothetical protein